MISKWMQIALAQQVQIPNKKIAVISMKPNPIEEIKFKNGSSIKFITYDKEKIRGSSPVG